MILSFFTYVQAEPIFIIAIIMLMLTAILKKKRRKSGPYINLYHHLSRSLWYDMANKTLIEGEEAREFDKRPRRKIGFHKYEIGTKANVWGKKYPETVIYGEIYEML